LLELAHHGPRLTIRRSQPPALRGAVEDVRVHVVRPEVLERASERRSHLRPRVRPRVVGDSAILSVHVGELGLEKDVLPRERAALDGCLDGGADGRLRIVEFTNRRIYRRIGYREIGNPTMNSSIRRFANSSMSPTQ
jgi:hypothetical protein